jgi:hypothetical protein
MEADGDTRAWKKQKRQEYTQRLKARRVAEWDKLTDEEKEKRKEDRKEQMQELDRRLDDALITGLNVCVDLSFDPSSSSSSQRALMKECKSVCKQLSLSWALLKQVACPVHLHLTSFVEDSVLGQELIRQGMPGWKMSKHGGSPWEVFPSHPRDKIVVLSPDASTVLTSFAPDEVYVIGGIVDRSVRKAETLEYATRHGLSVRRLPIQEFLPGRQSHILNIDHVVHTVCEYLHTNDWTQTLLRTVPIRRQVAGGKKQRKEDRKRTSVAAADEDGDGDSCVDADDEAEGGEEKDEGIEEDAREPYVIPATNDGSSCV